MRWRILIMVALVSTTCLLIRCGVLVTSHMLLTYLHCFRSSQINQSNHQMVLCQERLHRTQRCPFGRDSNFTLFVIIEEAFRMLAGFDHILHAYLFIYLQATEFSNLTFRHKTTSQQGIGSFFPSQPQRRRDVCRLESER